MVTYEYKHLLLKISGDFHDEKLVYNVFLGACHAAKAKVLGTLYHSFYPEGFSAVVLLSESHVSIHTWPDLKEAKLDFFSCSPDPGFNLFMDHFKEYGFIVMDHSIIKR